MSLPEPSHPRAEYVRDEKGKFTSAESEAAAPGSHANPEMMNILRHIETLEAKLKESEEGLSKRDQELLASKMRIEKFTEKTREGMKSALNSLMKKWIDSVETKDVKTKAEFTAGMDKLVQQGAEDNGVWRMMVAASALHEQQQHNLDSLRKENIDLKNRIDGHYAKPEARLREDVLGKRKADCELDAISVAADSTNIWSEFASDMSGF